ncbi:WD domain, G-beta repeat protein [Opisthorchis viverrini]|uniref:WD domain, G-beta repeat protein n=1 Tax=Opisthorchis viverrini TaxID=6198 RepID=A0A1S8WVB5_OPIVI|nr:WD domain, G-beta repeat protein [Opisthorchis viverrini]
MALWDWHDGKCLEFKVDTRYQHVNIKSHDAPFLNHRLLFCCGRYPHIVVLHAVSLSVLFNLASQAHPDWISDFVVFTHSNKRHEVVLGISHSNVATLWTLNGEEVQGEVKYEHESRTLDCLSTVIQVDCCPLSPRCVLLVTRNGWQLLDAMACSIFHSHPNPDKDPLVGGQFLDRNAVLVYCRSGAALVYRFDTRTPSGTTSLSCGYAALVARLLPPTDKEFSFVAEPMCHLLISPSQESPPFLLGGTSRGQLLHWRLDRTVLGDGTANTPQESDAAHTFQPSFVSDLVSTWRQHPPNPLLSLSTTESSSTGKPLVTNALEGLTVTACIQISQMMSIRQGSPEHLSPRRLAFGFSNGQITIVRLADFLRTTYWTSDFRSSARLTNADSLLKHSRFHLCGHVGPVTSLLHPASADEYLVQSCDDRTSGSSIDCVNCQFNPDHLVSGGADFTVRLWDLDPWRGGLAERVRSRRTDNATESSSLDPACLAVFQCHASPCIALTSCICSVGADGSVSVINLSEQRHLLSTGAAHSLSDSPVMAIGWRVPEDLLLIAHVDGSLEIWDVMIGCLERLERDQLARDVLEQAHFVVEVQNMPATFGFAASVVPYLPNTRSQNSSVSFPSFCGSVSQFACAASVKFAASSRRRWPHSAASVCSASPRLQELSVVQLQTVGSTCSSSADLLSSGPAALVFHWDVESAIVDLLAENEKVNTDGSPDIAITHTASNARFELVQLLLSIVHPWGVDTGADRALRACLSFTKESPNGTDDEVMSRPHLHDTLCLGLLSRHGCLSISMPGWPSVPHGQNSPVPQSSSSRLHSLHSLVSTTMLLTEMSLVETLTCLSPDYLVRLFESVIRTPLQPEPDGEWPACATIRANWLQLAARLIGPVAQSTISVPTEAIGQFAQLEYLVRKWQDRTLPVRYASRTLLLTLLDHMGDMSRQNLIDLWSKLLPLFSQSSRRSSVLHSTGLVVNHDRDVNGSSPSLSGPVRKQSIPPIPLESGGGQRLSTTIINGGPYCDQPSSPGQYRSDASQQPVLTQAKDVCRSGSLCLMSSASLESGYFYVDVGEHLLSLDGYRLSARGYAGLQVSKMLSNLIFAMATVILGVIGFRFGAGVKHRHPAVASRDLISDIDPISAERGSAATSRGLAAACFASPDTHDRHADVGAQSTSEPTIQQFCEDTSDENYAVPEGFRVDNYQLARALSQCLTALLLNRVPQASSTPLHGPDFSSGDSPSTAASAMAAMLSSNVHTSLRRAAIDLLGRGFIVWEPYVDLNQIINALLPLTAKAESLLCSLVDYLTCFVFGAAFLRTVQPFFKCNLLHLCFKTNQLSCHGLKTALFTSGVGIIIKPDPKAMATVILGVIGFRFGAGVKHRHPAVASRDLISDIDPISAERGSAATSRGLAAACFASPDTHDRHADVGAQSTSEPTIQQFCEDTSDENYAVPEGFRVDNYQLARALSQCLTALLLNRAHNLCLINIRNSAIEDTLSKSLL